MECGCSSDRDQPVPIVSEENKHCHQTHHDCGLDHQEECCIPGAVDHSTAAAALPPLTHHCHLPHRGGGMPPSDPSLSEVGATEQALFSKEVISFSLFGRIHPKCKRPWNESLSTRIAEVQESYKNIPPKLYFSPSSVSLEGIGVYTAENLPQDTSLGPYVGHHVTRDQIDGAEHNQWLWEVYDNTSLAYFVDASDPKLSNYNWMNFIQCARNSTEQNLKLTQISDNLYFVATRDISSGEELLVWYDEVQYGVYMGLPTGFHETRGPFIEPAAMEPGAPHGHLSQTSCPPQGRATAHAQTLTRNPSEHRVYVQYSAAPSSAGHLSDSASTDDSGISLSLEHSGGGPTPPGGITTSFDHASNSSGSSSHLDVTSTTSRHASEPFHQPQETAAYQPGEPPIYSTGFHVSLPAGSPLSQQASAGGVTHWIGAGGPGLVQPVGGPIGNRKQLLYGMFSRYEDGTRWQCEECKKLFSSQGSLRAHARIHTGERPYQCQYCCRTFCQASTLRSHERLHTGEKPYKCEHCGRAFTQSAGLRSHLKTHRYDS